ncbi:MAG: NUDIX hydrolase [Anaerolineae bacterium]|nr:NUDIX hydrolase [Anaerolineae bacterium]
MVQSYSNNVASSTLPIQNMSMLRASLLSHGIELSAWGTGDAKSVENLWEELRTGEIRLQADPFCRVLSGVVQVIIRHPDGRILIEEEQVFHDGRRRQRNIPPAEKMLNGESYADAAKRCLVEELHLNPRTATVLPFSHRTRQELRNSWSYPGLTSLYTIHQIQVRVPDVPLEDFRTTELDRRNDAVVREHLWVWKAPPPGLLID